MFGLFVNDLKDGLWVEFDKKGIEILNLHYSSGVLDSIVDLTKPIEVTSTVKILQPMPEIIDTVVAKKDVLKNGVYSTFYAYRYLFTCS